MRIDLEAKVRTKDGHDAGNVRRVIVDPATERITGFVISTGGLLGREVIVDEEAFEAADPGGASVTLSLTKEELQSQPIFDESDYVAPEVGWAAPAGRIFSGSP
jgi:sporulation protein YlmC with PRC-barrel domain